MKAGVSAVSPGEGRDRVTVLQRPGEAKTMNMKRVMLDGAVVAVMPLP